MDLYARLQRLVKNTEDVDYIHNNIKTGITKSRPPIKYNLSAPFVTPFALLGCKWESETLPKWARKWDNNVTLNGDNGNWIDTDGDGIADVSMMPLEDTPEVRQRCYWGPLWLKRKIHPRSYLARLMWVGFRNRGKQAYVDEGVEIDPHAPMSEYTLTEGGVTEVLRIKDGYAHYTRSEPFLKYFVKKTQKGWKVGNVNILQRVAIPVNHTVLRIKE